MPTVQFVGASRSNAENGAANPARLVNLYREAAGDSRMVLRAVPGMELFGTLDAPVGRAVCGTGTTLYAASGGFLSSVSSGGSAAVVASLIDDEDTSIATFRSNVMVAAGGEYTVYDGSSAAVVTGGAFSAVGSVAHLNGWTVLTEAGGRLFEWTELADPGTRNALHVATAEARDDDILAATAFGGNLYILKQTSAEIWGLTGLAGADAFARVPGGVTDRGILAKGLFANFGNGLFAVGNDGVAYIAAGSLDVVSTPAVESAIAQGTPTRCFYYERDGGKFCVIRFADRPSWVYELTTGEWHERASGQDGAWSAIDCARAFGNRWFTLDATGRVAELTSAVTDFGGTLYRRATSTLFEQGGKEFGVDCIEAKSKRGYEEASLMLEMSRDGGRTWGTPMDRSTGPVGAYDYVTAWNGLGSFRKSMTARLSLTDPVDVPIYADWNMDVG